MQTPTLTQKTYANVSVFSLQLSILFKLCLLLNLMTPIATAIIDLEVKCLGNKILISNVCVQCPLGQVVQDKKCVKLQDFNFSSLGPLGQKNCIQVTNTNNNPNLLGKCVRCLTGFQLHRGVCIQKGCTIFSETLMKCLDTFTDSDLLLLKTYQTREKGSSPMNVLPIVLPVTLQKFIEIKRDDAVELGLEMLNIKLEINEIKN